MSVKSFSAALRAPITGAAPLQRRGLALLAACALGTAAFGFSAPSAQAHAIIMSSTPTTNGTVKPGAQAVDLRFNSRIDKERSRLQLIGPDGKAVTLALSKGDDTHLQAETAPLAAGAWRLRWQVLAIDGHITRGDIPFTVAP